MNVKTLCLSILYEGESTGYEIRRICVEGECAYFIEASYGSIYPALAKLEDEGMVTSRVEPQKGKPAKKVYSITAVGRKAFAAQLAEPLGEDLFRSPFLLFARYAHILPRELVAQRAQEFLDRMTEKHRHLEEAMAERGSNAGDTWVISFGRAVMGVAQQHMQTHMHELIDLALAEPNKDAAE